MASSTTTAELGAGRTPDPVHVGMVVWLASELMFFAGLFAAWFTLRADNEVWPPPGVHLEVGRTALATVVLLGSSITMHAAVLAARRHDRRSAAQWLLVTVGLGAIFVANLVWEYLEAPFALGDHGYGTVFYLLTGFHGLHLVGGMVFLAAVAGIIVGRSRAPAERTVEMAAYYWHFVDVVWVAMFVTVYLIA